MEEKDIKKELISFAWPILITSIVQELYNITNSAIVGNYVSLEALSAVSACTWICNIFSYLFFGIGLGTGVLTSRYVGSNDKEKLQTAIYSSLMFSIVGGILLTVVAEMSIPLLMKVSNINSDIYDLAKSYLSVYFLGTAFLFIYNSTFNILRGFSKTKNLLYYSIASSLTNLIFGLLFVRVFHMNVNGTAIATIIAQGVSAFCCLKFLFSNKLVDIDYKKTKFSFPMIVEICRLGIPAGIQNLLIAVSSMLTQSQVNLFSNAIISGIGVGEKVANWGQRVANAFSSSTLILTARYMGAEDYDSVRKTIKHSISLSTIFNTAVIALLVIFAPNLAKMFNDDPEVIKNATDTIRYMQIGFFFLNYSHIYNSACRGAGNVRVPMLIAIFAQAVCKYLVVAIGINYYFSPMIIYLGYVVAFSLAGLLASLYFHLSPWTKAHQLRK